MSTGTLNRSRTSLSTSQRRGNTSGQSVYSMNTTSMRKQVSKKEDIIQRKITEIFKDKDRKMHKAIEQTIYDDKLRIYKQNRLDYETELNELEAERKRIIKRKKNKKDRVKALRSNTKQQLLYISRALQATVLYYKDFYFENDYYRYQRITQLEDVFVDEKDKAKARLDQLKNFFESPFKDDRRFTIAYLAQMTRDNLAASTELVNTLFFDKIFRLLLTDKDEKNRHKAFEILCNLINSDQFRKKLAKETKDSRDKNDNYFKQVYLALKVGEVDEKTLEKLSWMTTLICFHADMIEQIQQLNLLDFIIKLVDAKFSSTVRSNAVLAISLLTYHESLFNELRDKKVLELVMSLCLDKYGDLQVKQFSTLALVHFALSKRSIDTLIDKGIMNLFNSLGVIDNPHIQTNVSWIFLALCNNGITGKTMLSNGITRDMFLVSCNPQFHQIRHLVIAGFAELGRSDELGNAEEQEYGKALLRIKEKAIVGMHEAFKRDTEQTINILLRFTVSEHAGYKVTAYWALKDYILLNHDCLMQDLQGVICAFVNGTAEKQERVQFKCANAISFLITHHLVFTQEEARAKKSRRQTSEVETDALDPAQIYVLDALMHLTGSESHQVRTRAFSTLSTLSTYASQSPDVIDQIQSDIKMPGDAPSRDYYEFIMNRIKKSKQRFAARYHEPNIELKYAGLYCLLRLAQEPSEAIAEEASCYLHHFYFPEHYRDNNIELPTFSGEELTVTKEVEKELSADEKTKLSVFLARNDLDSREIELDSLNEKFFMFVFKALLFSKRRRILYRLLDVINFYVSHRTTHQNEVLEPMIVLWMLSILEKHRQDSQLCLLAARTLLKLVDNHQITFDYQEMAVIKKFNRALENIDGQASQMLSSAVGSGSLDSSMDTSESEENLEEQIEKASIQKSAIEEAQKSVESLICKKDAVSDTIPKTPNLSIEELERRGNTVGNISPDRPKDILVDDDQMKKLRETVEAQVDQLKLFNLSIEEQNLGGSTLSRNQTEKNILTEPNMEKIPDCGQGVISQTDEAIEVSVIEEKNDSGKKEQFSHNLDQPVSPSKTEERSVRVTTIAVKKELTESKKVVESAELHENTGSVHFTAKTKEDEQSSEVPLRETQNSQEKDIRESEGTGGKRQSTRKIFKSRKKDMSDYCESDAQESALRDCLIKSFMVIFTNEKSQHLLLNKDIIDIAFNCLEYCTEISVEAKKNLARLISIIFKFPQVQERVLQTDVVLGVVHLLSQSTEQYEILQMTVRACTYISLNFKFVSSTLSLNLLQALIPLLDVLQSGEDRLRSKISSITLSVHDVISPRPNDKINSKNLSAQLDKMSDRDNCIFAISNLLKGKSQNASYFIARNGPARVMRDILKPQVSLELVELCIGCIKQLANTKGTFSEFLSYSDENLTLLPQCLKKCFSLCEDWHLSKGELLLFSKIIQGKMVKCVTMESQDLRNLDYKNVETIKLFEKIDETANLSVKMTAICKIRSHCFFTAAGCFKAGFETQFLTKDCQLLSCLVEDLKKDSLNDYLYLHIILCLQSLQKDKKVVRELLTHFFEPLFDLLNEMTRDKKVTLLNTLVQLVMRIPEELCDLPGSLQLFGKLFEMALSSEVEEITLDILWLQTTLLELKLSDSQHEKGVALCQQLKSVEIFTKCIDADNEKIVLSAVTGLCTLANIPAFRPSILIENGDALFEKLAILLKQRIHTFTNCNLEVETSLVEMLAVLTEGAANSRDSMLTLARRRVTQEGFVEFFLAKVPTIEYRIEDELEQAVSEGDEGFDTNLDEFSTQELVASPQLSPNYSLHAPSHQEEEPSFDFGAAKTDEKGANPSLKPKAFEAAQLEDFERLPNSNKLVEQTLRLTANVCALPENHSILLTKAKLLQQVVHMVKVLLDASPTGEPVDLNAFSFGNLELGKYLALTLLHLCQEPTSQAVCLQSDLGRMLIHTAHRLLDYEVQAALYAAMVALVLSPNKDLQRQAVEQGLFQELVRAAEDSEFFKVRRICSQAVEKAPERITIINERAIEKNLF